MLYLAKNDYAYYRTNLQHAMRYALRAEQPDYGVYHDDYRSQHEQTDYAVGLLEAYYPSHPLVIEWAEIENRPNKHRFDDLWQVEYDISIEVEDALCELTYKYDWSGYWGWSESAFGFWSDNEEDY